MISLCVSDVTVGMIIENGNLLVKKEYSEDGFMFTVLMADGYAYKGWWHKDAMLRVVC